MNKSGKIIKPQPSGNNRSANMQRGSMMTGRKENPSHGGSTVNKASKKGESMRAGHGKSGGRIRSH